MFFITNNFSFYFYFVFIPIALSIAYYIGLKQEKKKTIRLYKILKGIFYVYLAISIIVQMDNNPYTAKLTTGLALMEGLGAIAEVMQKDWKDNKR